MGRLYVPGSATDQAASVTDSTTDHSMTPEDEEVLKRQAEATPSEPVKAITAFLIYQDAKTGMWVGSADITTELELERPAGYHDMQAGCSVIADDISALKTAQNTAAVFDQKARQMQEQMQSQQLLQKLQTQSAFRRQ